MTPSVRARLLKATGTQATPHGHALNHQPPRRGLHVITWGCQMNVYDSFRMADVLDPLGYREVAAPELADLVILNTCHIRARATDKVFSELGRLHVMQKARAAAGGRMMVAVAGCVAQAEGALILARAQNVDIVLGPQTYHRLASMVRRAEQGARVLETDFPAEDKFDFLPAEAAPRSNGGLSAFLSIQEGCDKFCAFCVVPYTRGAESSRPAAAVIAEATRLVARGAREITLLGQNVNAWHGAGLDGGSGSNAGTWGLARLLHALAALPGLDRLRYTTSHPCDMDAALIAAHRDLPQLMPYLHLPVQSGSDGVLAAMNRRHTREDYLRTIDRLRAARPDIALSSDFIVGHPGETDADFEQTLDLVRRVRFMQAYSFTYSPRPGTTAAARADQLPQADKDARLQVLQTLLTEQQHQFNEACLGRTLDVMFSGPGRRPGQMSGRTPYLQPVHVEAGETLAGRILPVRITEARPNSLGGCLAEPVLQPRIEEPVCV